MQLRTGKSGAYRYLTCANKANKGALSCQGQSVRMDAVDEVVLSAMEADVFAPLRLKNLMSQLIGASNVGFEAREKDIARLQASLNNDKAGLKRLYLESRRRRRHHGQGFRAADLRCQASHR